MPTPRHRHTVLAALAGLWMCTGAAAAPPLTKVASQLTHDTDAKPVTLPSLRLPQSRLDLAAPAMAVPLFERPAAGVFATAQRNSAERSSASASPGLGMSSAGRLMSRPEMLARNFKREGLPVARLFQSENALVHVGLSPKGKPGLWFVEKLH